MPVARRPVLDAFPEHRELVVQLIDTDEGFADLCEQFDDVVAAHTRALSGRGSRLGHASEYHGLRLELEAEILGILDGDPR